MLLIILQCIWQPLAHQQSSIEPQMLIVPRLRNPGLGFIPILSPLSMGEQICIWSIFRPHSQDSSFIGLESSLDMVFSWNPPVPLCMDRIENYSLEYLVWWRPQMKHFLSYWRVVFFALWGDSSNGETYRRWRKAPEGLVRIRWTIKLRTFVRSGKGAHLPDKRIWKPSDGCS